MRFDTLSYKMHMDLWQAFYIYFNIYSYLGKTMLSDLTSLKEVQKPHQIVYHTCLRGSHISQMLKGLFLISTEIVKKARVPSGALGRRPTAVSLCALNGARETMKHSCRYYSAKIGTNGRWAQELQKYALHARARDEYL